MDKVFSKVCNSCKQEKTFTEYTLKSDSGKLSGICKECCKERRKNSEREILKRNSSHGGFGNFGYIRHVGKLQK